MLLYHLFGLRNERGEADAYFAYTHRQSAALRAGGRELFDIHFTTITGTILLNGGVLT